MKTIAAALALLVPALATAQGTGPSQASQPAQGAPAQAPDKPKEEKSNTFVIEGFVGPALMSHPDVGGITYGGALRFLSRKGMRTDFGLLILGSQYSASQLSTSEGVAFDNDQSALGGGLELNVGFGIAVVDLMFGGGMGLLWIDGKVSQVLGSNTYARHPNFYLSYGGELGINIGPVRPVLRITRIVDMKFDADRAQAGDASGTMILGGLGVAL